MKNDSQRKIEPELEARLMALVHGEVSPFEKEEIERLMRERPEVVAWKNRLEKIHHLLEDGEKPVDDKTWKLSPARREKILAELHNADEEDEKRRARSSKRAQSRVIFSVAACFAVTLFLAGLVLPVVQKSNAKKETSEIVSYSAPASEPDSMETGNLPGDKSEGASAGRLSRTKQTPRESDENAPKDALLAKKEKSGGNAANRKPNAPASLMSKVIASDGVSPQKVPVPEMEIPEPSTDFGDGDDFGEGWGDAGGDGGGAFGEETTAEEKKAKKAVQPAPASRLRKPGAASQRQNGQNKSDSIVTAGNRSGDSALSRNSNDAILNNPERGEKLGLQNGDKADSLSQRTFDINADELDDLLNTREENKAADPFATGGGQNAIVARKSVVDLLSARGVKFEEGASASVVNGRLVVRNTPEQLDLMGAVVQTAGVEDTSRNAETGNPFSYHNESPGQRLAMQKMKQTKIPRVDFEDTTLREAVDFLNQRSRELDSTSTVPDGKKGLQIELSENLSGRSEVGELGRRTLLGDQKIKSLKLKDVPIEKAIQYIADATNTRYKVDNSGKITFLTLTAGEEDEIVTGRFPLSGKEFAKLKEIHDGYQTNTEDPFAPNDTKSRPVLRAKTSAPELFAGRGVRFSDRSSLAWLPGDGQILVRNTPAQLELIEAILDEVREEIPPDVGETSAAKKPDSTFSLNVSDVSFKLAQAALEKGERPVAGKIRVEEFVNAFDYGDSKPSQSEKVACVLEQAAHPYLMQRNLLRVSLSTAALGRQAGTPLRLTVLLDRSGSMEREDRAESVRQAFRLLAAQLTAADEVTLIGFARTPHLLAAKVKGDQCGKLAEILAANPSEGGTNLEAALKLGLEVAKQNFVTEAQNRVILLTDGAANLGDAKPKRLAKLVESMRAGKIAFDACGVGAAGLNDEILESLTRKGDGRYYFLNRPEDADEGFAKRIAGALRPAAVNVKVQVIFNPKRVGKYQLYGFEKHRLKKEDFRNDAVDAAEMAAEESGVAMYHFQALPEGKGEVGTISVRFQDTATGEMVERLWTIPYVPQAQPFEDAKPSLQLAGAALFLGEKLRGSALGQAVEFPRLQKTIARLTPEFSAQPKFQELRKMVTQAKAQN